LLYTSFNFLYQNILYLSSF